jgi:HAD superfamily hydrolase (TIGR01490 family)
MDAGSEISGSSSLCMILTVRLGQLPTHKYTASRRPQANRLLKWCVAQLIPRRTMVDMSVAVFDIDNTLVRGATLMPATTALVREGLVDLSVLPRALFEQLKFRATSAEPEVGGILERCLQAVAGVAVVDIEDVFNRVAQRIAERSVHRGTLDIAKAHLLAGHEVWLATAGPSALAERLASVLGFTGAVGTQVDIADGLCTGKLAGPLIHGGQKASAIADLARSRGWSLSSISAYSDSMNDRPLLELVGDPHAVNPDRGLRKLARQEGWPVHDTSNRRVVLRTAGFALLAGGLLSTQRRQG